ncbi:EamA family transporter, partial [Azospirillum brasilense]|nr:EamA family transporter [Azospirillum brasilense]
SVLMAQFPSKEIAQLSYEFRTLGLGFANLGGLLRSSGLPYDSPEGRAYCPAISAGLTGVPSAPPPAKAQALGAEGGSPCAVCSAATTVGSARGPRRGLDIWSIPFWPFFLSALFWLLATPAIDYAAVEVTWETVGFVLFIGVFGTVAPYWLYLEGLKTIEPFPATVIGMLDPVFAGVTAFLLLGETFELPQLAGMVVVCAVIVFLKRNESAVQAIPRPAVEPS